MLTILFHVSLKVNLVLDPSRSGVRGWIQEQDNFLSVNSIDHLDRYTEVEGDGRSWVQKRQGKEEKRKETGQKAEEVLPNGPQYPCAPHSANSRGSHMSLKEFWVNSLPVFLIRTLAVFCERGGNKRILSPLFI